MVFIKYYFLKSDTYFNPIYLLQVFQDPGFLGFRFFRVQIFPSPGFSGFGSRVRVQVLEISP